MADFRALCVELVDCLEKSDWPHQYKPVFEQWIYTARKALAESEPRKLLYGKGDLIRLTVPTVSGWQGIGVVLKPVYQDAAPNTVVVFRKQGEDDDEIQCGALLREIEPVAQRHPEPQRRYLYSPAQIAECGGPCEQGPEHCDCGELWITKPAPEPKSPSTDEL